MTTYSRVDRTQIAVLHRASGLIMAKSRLRSEYEQFAMRVATVTELAPRLRRFTFVADGLASYATAGPDEYFALLLPPAPGAAVVLPPAERINIRAAVNALRPEVRPVMRWYTVRAHRPERSELDVDVVLHGDQGPASAWALTAGVGAEVGFRASGAAYNPAPDARRQLFVADETSGPALAAILDALPRGADRPEVTALLVTSDDDTHEHHPDVEVLAASRESVVDVVRERLAGDGGGFAGADYAWACGEAGLATGIRRLLVKELGVDRRHIMFSGYWRIGKAEDR